MNRLSGTIVIALLGCLLAVLCACGSNESRDDIGQEDAAIYDTESETGSDADSDVDSDADADAGSDAG